MSGLEQQVTDEMRRRADLMTVPLPHVNELVRDGKARQARDRRRLVLVAAAAIVAVLAIGPWFVSRSGDAHPGPAEPRPTPTSSTPTSSRTLDDLPQGRPPAVPYLQGGALHVGDTAVETAANRVIAAGPTVLVGRTDERAAHWWLLTDGELKPFGPLDGVFTPVISPSGDLLVWTSYPDARTTRVTAWRPQEAREVDHVDLDAAYAECCGGGQQIELLGIDARGTLYWQNAVHSPDADAWSPGAGAPSRVPMSDVPALRPSTPPALPDSALPEGVLAEPIGLEQDGSVLVGAFSDPRRHYVLRCSSVGDRCERTLGPGRVSSWVFPENLR